MILNLKNWENNSEARQLNNKWINEMILCFKILINNSVETWRSQFLIELNLVQDIISSGMVDCRTIAIILRLPKNDKAF